jgi:uncharacterized RDD family membrane protein YckC
MEILDAPQPNATIDPNTVVYGGFWVRLGAMFIDGLVLAPVSVGLMYYNATSSKNALLLAAITLLSLAYKPVMEYIYGATLGKMALKLRVVDAQFEKAGLQEILLRNIFHIVPSLVTLAFTISIYLNPEFEDVNGFMEYSQYTGQFKSLQIINFVSGLITIIDAIVLVSDSRKRSLHDKIAQTYVIERQPSYAL